MSQTYRFETQVWKGIPEGLCVSGYRCSGKRAGGGWVGIDAALSECGDNASRIMAIPCVGIALKNICLGYGHAPMLAVEDEDIPLVFSDFREMIRSDEI